MKRRTDYVLWPGWRHGRYVTAAQLAASHGVDLARCLVVERGAPHPDHAPLVPSDIEHPRREHLFASAVAIDEVDAKARRPDPLFNGPPVPGDPPVLLVDALRSAWWAHTLIRRLLNSLSLDASVDFGLLEKLEQWHPHRAHLEPPPGRCCCCLAALPEVSLEEDACPLHGEVGGQRCATCAQGPGR